MRRSWPDAIGNAVYLSPDFTEVTVPAITVDEVIARFVPARTSIDFVSIDVEGTELDVLEALTCDGTGRE